MNHHLHFTFGPVQSFVAQARRTRDLYAGSLLLSHLAMAAMRGASEALGDIILPDFDALTKTKSDHATAPNRFVAEFEDEQAAAAAGKAAATALRAAWQKIADAVWSRYLEKHAALGRNTADIWQRQVANFWNIAWAVGNKDEHDLLDRRKNWQTHFPPVEGGDHCVLMHQWQELSGFTRSQQRWDDNKQNAFWDSVRGAVKDDLDLEPGERLCAIAFIKRFFPSVAKEAIGQALDPKGWPSTVTIAALPWMRKVAATHPQKAADYAALVQKHEPDALLSSGKRIVSLEKMGLFGKLSGNYVNRTALENADDTPLRPGTERRALPDKLGDLEKVTGDRAGNFYAVLLMDGDNMGVLLRQHGPQQVTTALTKFATAVPGIIAEHDGITIYAGGDDLLALLPLDRALDAATAARTLYQEAFGTDIPATISAAIVLAHYRCTFSRVLASAHELLDDVAKDKTGRDSLAIRVLKPGGATCEWSTPFDHFMKTSPHVFSPLIASFKDESLSASLLYNLRERFTHLISGDTPLTSREELHALFTAEALIGKTHDEHFERKRSEMQALMNELLKVTELMCRNPETKEPETTRKFTFDGPRLVKFLALDGKEGAE